MVLKIGGVCLDVGAASGSTWRAISPAAMSAGTLHADPCESNVGAYGFLPHGGPAVCDKDGVHLEACMPKASVLSASCSGHTLGEAPSATTTMPDELRRWLAGAGEMRSQDARGALQNPSSEGALATLL